MIVYVAHKYGGDKRNIEKSIKICHDLQVKYPQHTFICPLIAFSYLSYNEIGCEEEMRMCFDLLSMCDILLVASEVSNGVSREIEYSAKNNIRIIDGVTLFMNMS